MLKETLSAADLCVNALKTDTILWYHFATMRIVNVVDVSENRRYKYMKYTKT